MKNKITTILQQNEVGQNGLSIDTIVQRLVDGGLVGNQTSDDVKRKALAAIRQAENIEPVPNGRGGRKQGWYRVKRVRAPRNTRKIAPIVKHEDVTTTYTGTAGEFAVMTELLFQGYNVNRMTVDEGVDIVANKDNRFYFIQVKTAYLDSQLKATFTIKTSRFELFKNNNDMRYVFVVRCASPLSTEDKVIPELRCFAFTNVELDRMIVDDLIHQGEQEMSIKIKFNETDFIPYVYNRNEKTKITYNMDRVI